MTVYVTRSYSLDENNKIVKEKRNKIHDLYLKHLSKRPSKVFGKMFSDSSVWMGYTDSDVKNAPDSLNYYSTFDSKRYSNVDSDSSNKKSSNQSTYNEKNYNNVNHLN